MATLPSPPTQAASSVVTSTLLNTIRDCLQFLMGSTMTGGGGRRAFAHLRQTVAQAAFATGTWTDITFDTEDADYDNGHSTVTNTQKYVAATTGWYEVSGGVAFAANATGRRGCRYAVNSVLVSQSHLLFPATAANTTVIPSRTMSVFLNSGDSLTLQGWQESGGTLATAVTDGTAGTVGSHLDVAFGSQ